MSVDCSLLLHLAWPLSHGVLGPDNWAVGEEGSGGRLLGGLVSFSFCSRLPGALNTEASWTSWLMGSGQPLISRGDCGGLPGERGEGTISLLSLDGWGGSQAGDKAVSAEGVRSCSLF